MQVSEKTQEEIVVDIEALKLAMFKRGFSQTSLAKEIGISPRTVYSRFRNGKFRLNEIEAIKDALKLEDPVAIFFAKKVSDKTHGALV